MHCDVSHDKYSKSRTLNSDSHASDLVRGDLRGKTLKREREGLDKACGEAQWKIWTLLKCSLSQTPRGALEQEWHQSCPTLWPQGVFLIITLKYFIIDLLALGQPRMRMNSQTLSVNYVPFGQEQFLEEYISSCMYSFIHWKADEMFTGLVMELKKRHNFMSFLMEFILTVCDLFLSLYALFK